MYCQTLYYNYEIEVHYLDHHSGGTYCLGHHSASSVRLAVIEFGMYYQTLYYNYVYNVGA